MNAYGKTYLADAQENLGVMLDYAVNHEGLPLDFFFQLFLTSNLSRLFAKGEPFVICGQSGVELAWQVLEENGIGFQGRPQLGALSRSEEFWTGWALAYYQWDSGLSFQDIDRTVPVKQIAGMYHPYHEMGERHFCDAMDTLFVKNRPHTSLHYARTEAGLSQSQLAKASSVAVRTIQHYEQRQKNINRANIDQLLRLSKALRCEPTDLLEPFDKERYEYALVRI